MEKREIVRMEALGINTYSRPQICSECGGIMVFKGVGEYRCEDCKALEYDDYGKTRNYIEGHPGATAATISEATGVSQKAIRQMLKESRLEITSDSKAFLKCEFCGANIRHGSLCDKCEAAYHRNFEEQERSKRNMSGYSMEKEKLDKGEKRFNRQK